MSQFEEPWTVSRETYHEGDGAACVSIEADGESVAVAHSWSNHDRGEPHIPTEEDWGRARRIVACVNACAGIPTDALEKVAAGTARLAVNREW